MIAPDVGGGFGGKLQTTPEEWHDLHGGPPPRQAVQVHRDPLRVADGGPPRPRPVAEAHAGGRPRTAPSPASRSTCSPTSGAYVALVGGGVPVLGAFMFNAIYKFPAYQFNCQTVLTNKTWTDAYRGAGRPEATYAIERIMDELAVEVGVDPLEIREKNWIKHEEFPFTTVCGLEYDSGNYEAATAKAKELFGYDGLRAEQKQRRETNDPVQLGIGDLDLHRDVRPGAVPGPGQLELRRRRLGARRRSGCCRPARSRSSTGASRARPGPRDGLVADRRRPARRRRSRTSRCCTATPRSSHKGMDTYGSRSLVVGGEALVKAADKVIEKAKPIAAHMLEASADDLEFDGGRFTVKGTDKGVAIDEIALATFAAHNLPDGVEPSLDCRRDLRPGQLLLPARHPPVRGGGRHRDRAA